MRHVYSSCLRGICTLTVAPGRSLACAGGPGLPAACLKRVRVPLSYIPPLLCR